MAENEDDRPDLGAMVLRLGHRLLAMEQPILDRHGMTMWAYIVLSTLARSPVRTQAALAASIGADKTRMIPVLDDLQQRGLIEREPDPSDRRVRLLELTDEGARVQRAIQADIRVGETELLGRLSDDDRRLFLRVLSEI